MCYVGGQAQNQRVASDFCPQNSRRKLFDLQIIPSASTYCNRISLGWVPEQMILFYSFFRIYYRKCHLINHSLGCFYLPESSDNTSKIPRVLESFCGVSLIFNMLFKYAATLKKKKSKPQKIWQLLFRK